MNLSELLGKKALIPVSSGGHIREALFLYNKFKLSPDSVFVTSQNEQTMSFTDKYNLTFLDQVSSRDFRGSLFAMPKIMKISKESNFDFILSTGAAIAISAVPAHLVHRIPYYYFESITRHNAPSLTGKILEFFPTVNRFSINYVNFGKKWLKGPSILDDYSVQKISPSAKEMKILVTLGTHSQFRFDRLIDEVLKVLSFGDEVTWQLGCTERNNLPGRCFSTIGANELKALAKESDVVFSHGGIGTVLDLLSVGVSPIVLPRLKEHKEHVDDHQMEALMSFSKSGLIQILDKDFDRKAMIRATANSIVKN